MTDVGNVSVGVVVHGDGLGQKLAATIRAAVLPVINELNQKLDLVKRKADQIDGRGMLKLAAGAQAANKAVDNLNRAIGNTDRTARISSLNQIRYYDQIADAADRSAQRQIEAIMAVAAAQTAAAAAPDPGRGGGGGGPPDPTGDLGGARAGGRRQGGLLGYLFSPVGMNAVAALTTLLNPAALGIAEVSRSIVDLAGAGAVLPAVFAGIASSVGVAIVGFNGVGDAVKELWTAMASGDAKDMEKALKLIEGLAPNAQKAVKALGEFQPVIHQLTQDIQNDIFAGLDGSITKFLGSALPTLTEGGRKIAASWNATLKELLRVGGTDETQGFLSRIFGNTSDAQNILNKAIEPAVRAIGRLTAEGSDFLPRLAEGVNALATRFDSFISKAAADGRLDQWIDRGFKAFADLGESILNIGKIITDITGSLGDGQTFLGWLREATGQLHDFLSSTEGQAKLSEFWADAREVWGQLQPVLADLLRVVMEVIKGFQQWGAIIVPIIGSILDILSDMPGLVSTVVTGLLALSTIKSFGGLLGGLSSVNTALGGVDRQLGSRGGGGVLGKLAQLARGVGILGGGALALGGLSNQSENGVTPGNAAATIGGAAVAGFALGGAPGAALATAVAALTTAFNKAKDELDRGTSESRRKWEEDRAAGPNRPGSREQQLAAVPALRGVQLPGQYNPDGSPRSTTGEDLWKQITSGGLPGYSVGPDGTVIGPNGPMPGITARAPRTPAPPPAPPRPTGPRPAYQVPTPDLSGAVTERSAQSAELTAAAVRNLGQAVRELPAAGTFQIINPTPEVIEQVRILGAEVRQLPNGEFIIDANTKLAEDKMRAFREQMSKPLVVGVDILPGQRVQLPPGTVAPNDLGGLLGVPGGADGMVIPGYAPGRDIVNAVLAPGEGVLIPEAVRGLGGASGIYALNSRFRAGLSRRYYADGGVQPGLAAGMPGPETELSLLRQIRDLLAGTGPGMSGPLAQTASNTADLSTAALSGTQGGKDMGFGQWADGTYRNPQYEMAAAAIQALGGDPGKFLGPNPALPVSGAVGGGGAVGGAGINTAAVAQALTEFAKTGNAGLLSGMGLNAADPVVAAIATARNKQSNNLDDSQISQLVSQIVGGGTFNGTMTPQNSTLIGALQRFREKMLKGGTGVAGLPTTGNWDALAAQESGGNWQINTGNGYTGGLQFDQSTWDAYKPPGAPARADLATREQQIAAGERAKAERGGPESLWPNTYQALGSPTAPSAVNSGWSTATTPYASDKGLVPAAAQLNDLILQNFPAIREIGGYRQDAHPDHPSGRALDIMIPGQGGLNDPTTPEGLALGNQIWDFLNKNQLIDPQGSLWQQKDHYNHIHARIAEGMEQGLPGVTVPPGAMGASALGGAAGGSGTPVYVTNWPGQGGSGIGGALAGGLIDGAGTALSNVATPTLNAVMGVGNRALPENVASIDQLVRERNPAAFAAAAGIKVGDYSRGPTGDPLMRPDGPAFDAAGRTLSDIGSLADRTSTSKDAVDDARHQQLLDVMSQVRDNGTEQVLQPIMQTAIQEGISTLKDSVTASMGAGLGESAGPIIAEAVGAAVKSAQGSAGGRTNGGVQLNEGPLGAAGQAAANIFMAQGGPIFGGTLGKDSVPIMAQHGEFVLDTGDVKRMGGPQGVERFRRALEAGKVKGYATGGGVKADNAALGAEFFGVADVPIIGAIVGALIAVLLSIVGIEIEQRDTLNEITDEARQFRGDFQRYDAAGRVTADSSGLSERTSSSEQAVADERIRILKIVISELIKFIIQQIVIPITKAVGQAAIQAGSSAAAAAVNSQAPGAGGIVGSLISGTGTALLDAGTEIWSQAAGVLTPLITDLVGDSLEAAFPNIMADIFSGAWLAKLFDPLTKGFGGMAGGLAALFGGLFGGAAMDTFDNGGMALGKGLVPKATIEPEMWLNPSDTRGFVQGAKAWANGGAGDTNSSREVHATIIMQGSDATPERVRDSLLELLDV